MTPRYEVRPIGVWTDPVTTDRRWHGRFRAPWANTLDLLQRETEALGAHMVVIQIDVTEGDLRRDGMLRANAKVGFPGVRVSFDSLHGPLTYATDEYDHWQANCRAIALALQALRAVDRYGVSKRGQQYTGWAALPAGSPSGQMTAEDAARLLAGYAEDVTAAQVLADPDARVRAYRQAARRTHPDHGGDPQVFARVTAARDLIELTADAR